MNAIPLKVAIYTTAAVVSIVIFLNLSIRHPLNTPLTTQASSTWWHPAKPIDVLSSIQNTTLGFERVFVLNMPERSDKRDAMSLAASLSGFSVDYVDGITGDVVVNKALPVGQEDRKMSNHTLGSWRAHMNAIRTIVEQGLSSALILEDDADWDIRIKSQLSSFALGSRTMLNIPSHALTHSPYGDGWDILWVGLCHDSIPASDPRVYTIPDPSVPKRSVMLMNNPELLSPFPEHTRVIHMTGGPICTFGYALSLRGAQKVLYGLSVKELTGIFDNALSDWCQYGSEEPRCISATPTYFYQHRFAGGVGKSSDINDNLPALTKGMTQNIRWSTRLNMEKLLRGRTDYEDSYPDDGVVG